MNAEMARRENAVTHVSFTATNDREIQRGLLGYLSFRWGDLLLDGVALRRTENGRLTLSLPERTDRHGRRHPIVRPVDDEARRRIEEAVFAALRGLDLECP